VRESQSVSVIVTRACQLLAMAPRVPLAVGAVFGRTGTDARLVLDCALTGRSARPTFLRTSAVMSRLLWICSGEVPDAANAALAERGGYYMRCDTSEFDAIY